MPKFANRPTPRNAPESVIHTKDKKQVLTEEGGTGYERDRKSALFLLAVTNMVSEDTFYESGKDRDDRFAVLLHKVAKKDQEWLERFIPYLRNTMQMRSASVAALAEYAHACYEHKLSTKNLPQLVADTLARADEPAELLAYWMQKYGRKQSQALKRGLQLAVNKLYTQRSALRYDGTNSNFRMADVLGLVNAKPANDEKAALFKYLMDKRYGRDVEFGPLETLRSDAVLLNVPEAQRRETMRQMLRNPDAEAHLVWKSAGWSWERLSGWLPGGMDAEAWEAVIPQMGYMALLRNLRNFDKAGISKDARQFVIDKLTDPEEVANSRQFPYRFWSAFKNTDSLHYAYALEAALDLSCQNIPEFSGRSLVLIDTSSSMQNPVSGKSDIRMFEIAALFGAALAKKSNNVDVVHFATSSGLEPVKPGQSVLRYIEHTHKVNGKYAHGTDMHSAVRKHWNGHDRVVIFSDMQTVGDGRDYDAAIKRIYGFNLMGYKAAAFKEGKNGRYAIGGFTDAVFKMIPLLERDQNAGWPF